MLHVWAIEQERVSICLEVRRSILACEDVVIDSAAALLWPSPGTKDTLQWSYTFADGNFFMDLE
jgi:hypothetical protein